MASSTLAAITQGERRASYSTGETGFGHDGRAQRHPPNPWPPLRFLVHFPYTRPALTNLRTGVGTRERFPPHQIDAPPGKWQLMIQLADPSLRDDGRYAIRLANADIQFIEAKGWNILADDIAID